MLRSLCHFVRAAATLTMFGVALAFPLSGHAETKNNEKSDLKAPPLTAAVINAMRHSIADRFVLPGDLKDVASVHLQFHMSLDRDGYIIGAPAMEVSGGSERTRQIVANAALRAIVRAAPYAMLPKHKYDAWKEVTLHFDTSQLNL